MSLFRLVLRNLMHAGARSVAVALGAALVSAFALLSAMVAAGAREDLAESIRRLGADVLVYPWGTTIEGLQRGHLMQVTLSGSILRSDVEEIRSLPAVEAASPQLYLATLRGSPYAASPEVYVVAIEPQTDFVLQPWISAGQRQLSAGQAVVGSGIIDANGTGRIDLGGYEVSTAGQLATTGTDMDETIFVSLGTAAEMGGGGQDGAADIPSQAVSTVLVRVKPGEDVREVAAQIMDRVPGSLAIVSARMLQAQRTQLFGLMAGVLAVAAAIWGLSVLFIGLVFTMTVNSRRRQIGVLRALGSPQGFVVRSLVAEGALLGLAGGGLGALLAACLALVLHDGGASFGLPLSFPTSAEFVGLAGIALLLAIGSVALASLVPVLRISRAEPACTMRE